MTSNIVVTLTAAAVMFLLQGCTTPPERQLVERIDYDLQRKCPQ
jgi:hypothetical protein